MKTVQGYCFMISYHPNCFEVLTERLATRQDRVSQSLIKVPVIYSKTQQQS